MKKKIILFVSIIMAVLMLAFSSKSEILASSATSSTYTLDYKGNWVVTQDAYLPEITFTQFGLDNPSDMVIYEDVLYISDTGNKRIVLVDVNTGNLIKDFKVVNYNNEEVKLKKPMGIYINSNPDEVYDHQGALLYLCDSEASRVYVLTLDFECLKVIEKPTSILFSNRDFHPQKIATDLGGNMYILGEGVYEGIMQLSIEGEFLGYFATNEVTMTFKEYLQDWLYTDEQKDKLPSKNPPVFSSVYADNRGIIYSTVTSTIDYACVQKHNTAGKNQFTKYPLISDLDMVDIYTDADGIIYAVSKNGWIYVYTQQGEFIYCFGGGGEIGSPDISGIFNKVSAIAVDDSKRIWVLDVNKAIIQSFEATNYANTIYQAINAYMESDYSKSIELWKEVLKLNQMSNLAHNNIGLNYLYSEEYDLAMHHLKISNNKTDYSKAYWEVRNIWLQNNLTWLIIGALVIFVAGYVLKLVDEKKSLFDPVRKVKKTIFSVPIIKEYFDMFRIARHPEDGFYDLKTGKKGSLRGALLILLTFFITYIVYLTSKGFIYQYVEIVDIDFFSVVFGFFAIIIVFTICNYLVTSITDGNGRYRDIFTLVMYSLAPAIIGLLGIVLLSHFVTESESFFLDVVLIVSVGWSVILMCMGMMEVQGYNFKSLLVSLLLTILLVIIIVLVLLIIFVLSQELINFIVLIIQEVFRNVTS